MIHLQETPAEVELFPVWPSVGFAERVGQSEAVPVDPTMINGGHLLGRAVRRAERLDDIVDELGDDERAPPAAIGSGALADIIQDVAQPEHLPNKGYWHMSCMLY